MKQKTDQHNNPSIPITDVNKNESGFTEIHLGDERQTTIEVPGITSLKPGDQFVFDDKTQPNHVTIKLGEIYQI